MFRMTSRKFQPRENQPVIVFAGAGASKAVASHLYPTTVEFFAQLPEDVKSDPLFRKILEFTRYTMKGKREIDIELILWRLSELRFFFDQLMNSQSIGGWFVNQNKLPEIAEQNWNFGSAKDIANKLVTHSNYLEGQINQNVFKFYSHPPPEDELDMSWGVLLGNLVSNSSRVEIFTTNYDVVLDAAVRELNKRRKKIDLGWTDGVYRQLDVDLWRDPSRRHPDTGLLTKLHGSVNWSKDGNTIFVSDPIFRGSHDLHSIIYPGFKGRPKDEPFQAFHSYLEASLQDAAAIVFVGFAFRDDFINEICVNNLNKDAPIIIINPDSKIEIPFKKDDVYFISDNFDLNSIKNVLNYLFGLKIKG